MAFNVNHDSEELSDLHDINVTPFIDVMLVLLIIFMVAAPLSTVSVPVDLPASTSKPEPQQQEPLYVSLQSDLSVAIGDEKIARTELASRLEQLSHGEKETRIFIRADKNVGYGEFISVVNLLRDSGYLKVALVGLDTSGQ